MSIISESTFKELFSLQNLDSPRKLRFEGGQVVSAVPEAKRGESPFYVTSLGTSLKVIGRLNRLGV